MKIVVGIVIPLMVILTCCSLDGSTAVVSVKVKVLLSKKKTKVNALLKEEKLIV